MPTESPRVASLLASATEIIAALGKGACLVGRSHECDYPSEVVGLPELTAPKFSLQGNSADVDRRVQQLAQDGLSVYRINRDALNLATPEGRILKDLRDRFQPMLGFNLHDQNRRRTVGDTRVLATNAVLAVTGDANRTVTPQRMLAMRTGVAIAQALEPFAPGGLARYDDEWSPRAFGDNLTAWGTPVVLIESGGVAPGQSPMRSRASRICPTISSGCRLRTSFCVPV